MAALAIDTRLLAGLASEIRRGTVIVTGTNGKGTTCRMLAGVMRASGLHPITNQEGANQPGGLATTLLAHASRAGHLPADDRAVGLFEVDEGSLPEILPQISPTTLVFTNVFRDQMDRYLDLDYLTRRWERCLRSLPEDTALVLNADDPRLAYLAADLPNPRIFYGLDDTGHRRSSVDHTSDFPRCPRCTGELGLQLRVLRAARSLELCALRPHPPGAAGPRRQGRPHRSRILAHSDSYARRRGGARNSAARAV